MNPEAVRFVGICSIMDVSVGHVFFVAEKIV